MRRAENGGAALDRAAHYEPHHQLRRHGDLKAKLIGTQQFALLRTTAPPRRWCCNVYTGASGIAAACTHQKPRWRATLSSSMCDAGANKAIERIFHDCVYTCVRNGYRACFKPAYTEHRA